MRVLSNRSLLFLALALFSSTTAKAQLEVRGWVGERGIAVFTLPWQRASAAPWTSIDPSLDVVMHDHRSGFHGGLSARVLSNGFSVNSHAAGSSAYTLNFEGSFRFKIATTRTISGSLLIESNEHNLLRMVRSPIGARDFSSRTPTSLLIPITLDRFGPIDFEMDVYDGPGVITDIRVTFVPDGHPYS